MTDTVMVLKELLTVVWNVLSIPGMVLFAIMIPVAHFSPKPNPWLAKHRRVAAVLMVFCICGFFRFIGSVIFH